MTGSKATGRLTLEALKKDDAWSLTSLKLSIDGRDDVIDLLNDSRAETQMPLGAVAATATALNGEGRSRGLENDRHFLL